ncbi:MAG: TraR/DksA family transcriptional regulator [Acidimicrobiales bacterium]
MAAPVKAPAPAKAAPKPPPKPTRGPFASEPKFLEEQRNFLLEEREVYKNQAADLRAEAESLALEREPGDVQFDEESGEGGTVAVDRERDLTLSAQAMATIDEIDMALKTIETKMYGACESCGQAIPKARLRALPYARLCVSCKSGGLHRR